MSEVVAPAAPVADTPKAGATESAAPAAAEAKPTGEATLATGAQVKPVEQAKPDGAAAEPAKPVAPEKYELKLPEGALIDAARLTEIAADAKAQGLSQDQAQALVEREHKAVSAYQTAQLEALSAKSDQWISEVQADKEIGGQDAVKNVTLAQRVLDRFGDVGFKQTLNDTKLGNHPGLVRLLVRIGKTMGDDQLVIPGPQSGAAPKSAADVFYGGSEQHTGG